MKIKLTVILIILLAAAVRFYHLGTLAYFSMDEEYWSYIPLNIARGYHLPLIGGSVADTGLYTTPWFVYLMAVVAFVGRGSPFFFIGFVSAIGVLTTFLVFYFGQEIFGRKVAIISSLLYASSMLMSLWDRHYWNASLTPILSVLTLYFLFRIFKGDKKYWIFLGFVLALAVSAHGTGVALVLFVVLAVIIFRMEWRNKYALFAGVIFIISFLPLVFFDARHNFLEARALSGYITKTNNDLGFRERGKNVVSGLVTTSGKLLAYVDNGDISSQLVINDDRVNHGRPLVISLIILVLTMGWRKRFTSEEKLCLLLLLATGLGLLAFRGQISEYYYSPGAVAIFFLVAAGLSRMRFLGMIFLAAIVGWNLLRMGIAYNSNSLSAKMKAVQGAIEKANGQPFSLGAECQGYCQLYGYRYLFTYLGQEPAKSYMDRDFSWLYQKRLPTGKPEKEIKLLINENGATVISRNI